MIEIRIPKLGLTMQNATVVEWKFSSGDQVKRGDVILIIETDKVTYEEDKGLPPCTCHCKGT